MRVLVAYATRHGSTQQVARAVADALRAHDAEVEFGPARGVRGTIGGQDLVVLGAPIYSGRWHRDAHRFLKRHRDELLAVPVAVFGMGPREPGEDAWQRSRRQLDRALAKRKWLKPVAVAVFGGVDPPGHGAERRRDLRNWETIQAWAEQIAGTARRGGTAPP